jgi:hypothetical protein
MVSRQGNRTGSSRRRPQKDSRDALKRVPAELFSVPSGATRRTGLEPATTGVTGRYSNQLSYRPRRGLESRHTTQKAEMTFS